MNKCLEFMRNECHFKSFNCWYIHGKKNDKDSNSRESMHEETTNKWHENNRAEPEPSVFGKPGPSLSQSNPGYLGEDDDNDERIEQNDEDSEGIKFIPVPNKIYRNKQNQQSERGQNKNNLTTIKRSNKLIQALNLPTVMNVNPRSVYNKILEFHTFVKEEEIDCIFMSESWERPNQPLESIIDLPNFKVISNPHQRKGVEGRPALIINSSKYHVKNLTQSLIEIPWGVEATWAIISPKYITSDSIIQKNCSLQFLFQAWLKEEEPSPWSY